jgi:hypothetical protein
MGVGVAGVWVRWGVFEGGWMVGVEGVWGWVLRV